MALGKSRFGGHGKSPMEPQKVNLKRRKRGRRKRKAPSRGRKWCIDRLKRRRSVSFKKRIFMDGWKRKAKANIGKCQEQWHSHMSELNERRHEFGPVTGDHDIRNDEQFRRGV